MSGGVAVSIAGLDHRNFLDITAFAALRRCRSVGDLASSDQYKPGSHGVGRHCGLNNRISSVEDLCNLESRQKRDEVMPSGVGNMGILESGTAAGSRTIPLASCQEDLCDDEFSTSSSLDKASNGKNNRVVSSIEAPSVDPFPELVGGDSGVGLVPLSSGRASPVLVRETSSGFSSPRKPGQLSSLLIAIPGTAITQLAGESPTTVSGFSSPQPLGQMLGQTCAEDSRRNSSDLGHVAPSTSHLAQGHAAEELFYRLNHARQTVDYVKRQAATFSTLNRATMGVWDALEMLNSLREYESALLGAEVGDPDMPLMEHALQTAEACRIAFPQQDWMGLVGLLHGLGKLLAHANFGSEPQWAVCGESFPVGCRFHPAIIHSQFFQANPDRRRRVYASPTGVYQSGCGLGAVCMSWSGAEYLYMVLAMNKTCLPAEALFMLRYQKFAAVLRPGQPYGELLSAFDRSMLPSLRKFCDLIRYKRRDVPGRLEGDALRDHYDALMAKYIPQGTLRW